MPYEDEKLLRKICTEMDIPWDAKLDMAVIDDYPADKYFKNNSIFPTNKCDINNSIIYENRYVIDYSLAA